MILIIPDEYLNYMKKMSPQAEIKEGGIRRFSNIVKWAAKKVPCYIYTPIFRKIVLEAEKQGFIRYDTDTKMWRGVDYDD